MEASRVLTPEVQEVTTTALAVPDQARAIVVTDNASYAAAAELLITIKGIRRKIEDTFKPIKQKMDAAKKEVLDQERAADAPLRQAEDYLKPQLAKWDAEQERIRDLYCLHSARRIVEGQRPGIGKRCAADDHERERSAGLSYRCCSCGGIWRDLCAIWSDHMGRDHRRDDPHEQGS